MCVVTGQGAGHPLPVTSLPAARLGSSGNSSDMLCLCFMPLGLLRDSGLQPAGSRQSMVVPPRAETKEVGEAQGAPHVRSPPLKCLFTERKLHAEDQVDLVSKL